jgi:hypothetical protein
MNNSILSIGLDKENDLWLGLDNGIVHIEINSPISIFYDNTGALGSVYSVVKTDKGFFGIESRCFFKYEITLFQIQKVKLGISVKLITSISSVIMKELIFMKTMSFKIKQY